MGAEIKSFIVKFTACCLCIQFSINNGLASTDYDLTHLHNQIAQAKHRLSDTQKALEYATHHHLLHV